MTKCIVLGEELRKEDPEAVEFVKRVDVKGPAVTKPSQWDVIELIARSYIDGLDAMFAYDYNDRSQGMLYLGHWNDGVV